MFLPSSLIAFLATSFVYASPIEVDTSNLAQLTHESFQPSVSSGTWFIEFFSPFCGHCRHFAPTWVKLAEQVHDEEVAGKGRTLGVKMAQVNCITDGDLCGEQKIRGYPTLRMYKDGVRVDEFNDNREMDLLVDFIAKHVSPPPVEEKKPVVADPPPMRMQESRSVISTNPNINPEGKVLQLSPDNFAQALAFGPVFVKFFAPWCGHCKKLAPSWISFAEKMKHILTVAEVNCDMHSSFCSEQGVEGFPTLSFYRAGHKLSYDGRRNLESMQSFAEKVMEPAVKELDKSWTTADIMKQHEVAFVFLHLTVDTRALDLLTDVGNGVLMNPPVHIYTSSSPELRGQFGQKSAGSALFALKANPEATNTNDIKPIASVLVTAGTSAQDIRNFLDMQKFPLVSQLTSGNFQSFMNAPHKPLILLMASPSDTQASDVRMLRAAEEKWRKSLPEGGSRSREILFVYMDSGKWGSWLKSMYGMKKDDFPSFVIADHSKLVYYDEYKSGKKFELSPAGLIEALQEASNEELKAKNSENIFERMARRSAKFLDSVTQAFKDHPFSTLAIVVAAIVLFMWFIFRLVSDDIGGNNVHAGRTWNGEKGRRLD